MHPIFRNDPAPTGTAYLRCLLPTSKTTVCGLPENHPGSCVSEHRHESCGDMFECTLCLYRSRSRFAQYGITPAKLGEIAVRRRAAKPHRRMSANGCVNCPVCEGPGYRPGLGSTTSLTHAKLIELEKLFLKP